MIAVLELLAILALGYLSAHFVVERLQRRFFFVSGIEYILLGVLVGPYVTGLMTPEVSNQLSPVMSLSIGSLGLLYGLQLRFAHPGDEEARAVRLEAARIAFIQVIVTLVLVGGALALLFRYLPDLPRIRDAWLPAALVLGTTAALSAPSAVRAVSRRYTATGSLPALIEDVARFSQVLGIGAFGFVFCFFHVGATVGIRELTTTEWVAVNIGIGLILGVLFFLFLGREADRSRLLLVLIGIVVFASGAAYYLNLSSLFVNLVLGIILGNTSGLRDELVDLLRMIEKPIYVVVLVFAGAAWNVDAAAGAWVVFAGAAALYFVVRVLAKQGGGRLAYATSEMPERLSSWLAAGLVAQGGVAVAMVVDYVQVYQNAYTDLVVTCVLASVILSEFVSPRLTRAMLADARQIALTAPDEMPAATPDQALNETPNEVEETP